MTNIRKQSSRNHFLVQSWTSRTSSSLKTLLRTTANPARTRRHATTFPNPLSIFSRRGDRWRKSPARTFSMSRIQAKFQNSPTTQTMWNSSHPSWWWANARFSQHIWKTVSFRLSKIPRSEGVQRMTWYLRRMEFLGTMRRWLLSRRLIVKGRWGRGTFWGMLGVSLALLCRWIHRNRRKWPRTTTTQSGRQPSVLTSSSWANRKKSSTSH